MVRIFEEGALVTAYECEGLEEDITVQIECSGGRDGDRTEKAPEQAAAQALPEEQHQQQPAEHVSQPTPGQSTFAIMSPEKPKRKFPLTRTGAAMAFLRGGRSR